MDKLKENGFTLALVGIGIALLAAAYFLVWEPYSRLSDVSDQLEKSKDALDKRVRSKDRIPTEDDIDEIKSLNARLDREFGDGVEFYDQRAKRFAEFFDGMSEPEAMGAFYATLHDRTDALVQNYRTQFNVFAQDGKEVPSIVGYPEKGGLQNQEEVIPSMRKFWILQAIVEAATAAGVGGLEEIEFPIDKRSASRRKKEDEEKKSFAVSTLTATVKVRLQYGKLSPFLKALYENDRVPFVSLDDLTVTNEPEDVVATAQLVRVVGPAEAEAPAPEEPPVLAELTLSALVWEGVVNSAKVEDK